MRKLLSGITTWDEARQAVERGADALGFVLEPRSPRFVEPERAKEIIRKLPPLVGTVGVFQDTPRYVIQELTTFCRLDWLLFLGQESPKECRGYAQPIIKLLNGPHLPVDYPQVNAFLINDCQLLQAGSNREEACYFLVPGTAWEQTVPAAFGLYFLLNADGTVHPAPLAGLGLPEKDSI